jgi:hypothetical protein
MPSTLAHQRPFAVCLPMIQTLSTNLPLAKAASTGTQLMFCADLLDKMKANTRWDEENSSKVVSCLKLLVENSRPTTEFYVAVQNLPAWIRDQCVCMERMQILMNQKITLRIPAAILLLDFYIQWIVMISLSLNASDSILFFAL